MSFVLPVVGMAAMAFPEGIGGTVQTLYPKDPVLFPTDAKRAKHRFFNAVGEVAKAADEKGLVTLAGQLGYTLFSGTGLKREIEIEGEFVGLDNLPASNELADSLYEILYSHVDEALKTLATIPAPNKWSGSFELLPENILELLGLMDDIPEELQDVNVDWGDIYVLEGGLKALQGVLCFLKGCDLSDDIGPIVQAFIDAETPFDLNAAFAAIPQAISGVRDASQTAKANACLKEAVEFIKKADAWMRARKGGTKHLIGYGAEDGQHLLTLPADDPIVDVIRANIDNLISAFDGPVAFDVKDIIGQIDPTSGLPCWMKESYGISLKPFFTGNFNATTVSIQTDDCGYLWPETLNDPTLAGMLPDVTFDDWVDVFEVLQNPQRWSYEAYVKYGISMPYDDGSGLSHRGAVRSIVTTVTGSGILGYAPVMGAACTDSRLQLFIDGLQADEVKGGDSAGPRQCAIRGEGKHLVEWVFLTLNGEVQPASGVHPVAELASRPYPCEETRAAGDDPFTATAANVYDGFLCDAEGRLVGTVKVKTKKQTVKKGVTNVTVSATVVDENFRKWNYTKGHVMFTDRVMGLVCKSKGCPEPLFDGLALGRNGMSGMWNGCTIIGARNGMGGKTDPMKGELEVNYLGTWSVTLTGEVDTVRLQLKIGKKGVVKVAGNWESGAKVSASAQLEMGDGFAYVPLMVKSKKTTPGLTAILRIEGDGISLLGATKLGLLAGGRTASEVAAPAEMEFSFTVGEPFSGRIALTDELSYPAKFSAKGLPSGLKINKATGVISGKPKKPGTFVATVTVKSATNKKATPAKVTITFEKYDTIPHS